LAALILVPTRLELERIEPLLGLGGVPRAWSVRPCGFGPVASASRAAALIGESRPDRVILVGIAGTYRPETCPVGSAVGFDGVACYGVGVGSGNLHRTAGEMGWHHLESDDHEPAIGDSIELPPNDAPKPSPAPTAKDQTSRGCHWLLTCCASSAGPRDVHQRLEKFPAATAEDMEGFAVAIGCCRAGVPLRIVRGISNLAGDRNPVSWKIDRAVTAAAELARSFI